MSATYPTLDAFYADPIRGDARKRSMEVDFGVWWQDGNRNYPRSRVSWVASTGEVYAFRQSPLGWSTRVGEPTGHTVAVLGVVRDRQEVERVLDGWPEMCGPANGLQWVHRRLVDAHYTDGVS